MNPLQSPSTSSPQSSWQPTDSFAPGPESSDSEEGTAHLSEALNSSADLQGLPASPPSPNRYAQTPSASTQLQQCAQAAGISALTASQEELLRSRLAAVQLSPATVLKALELTQSPNHPIWQKLGAKTKQLALVRRDLLGFTTTQGWRLTKRTVLYHAADQPKLVVANLWKDLRN